MAKAKSDKKLVVGERIPTIGAFEAFEEFLKELEWDKTDFQKAAHPLLGEDAAQQLFRWAYGQRSISRGMAIRAALVIALEYEKRYLDEKIKGLNPLVSLDNLDGVIQDFLHRAGYRGNAEILPPNFIWENIIRSRDEQSKELRIGYYEIAPWAEKKGGKGGVAVLGAAIEIAQNVMELLGIEKYKFVKVTWKEMREGIRDRTIHLAAPMLLKVPARLHDFRFSGPICSAETYALGMGFIGAKSLFEGTTLTSDNLQNCSLGYIEGEVGEIARFLLNFKEKTAFPDSNIDTGMSWVLEGIERKEPRLFAFESWTSRESSGKAPWKENLLYLEPPEFLEKTKFPICFGAHPDEYELIHAVNECLSLLKTQVPEILKRHKIIKST